MIRLLLLLTLALVGCQEGSEWRLTRSVTKLRLDTQRDDIYALRKEVAELKAFTDQMDYEFHLHFARELTPAPTKTTTHKCDVYTYCDECPGDCGRCCIQNPTPTPTPTPEAHCHCPSGEGCILEWSCWTPKPTRTHTPSNCGCEN